MLYNPDNRLTTQGLEIDSELSQLLSMIFQRGLQDGLNPRELSHLIIHAVTAMENLTLLTMLSKESERENL